MQINEDKEETIQFLRPEERIYEVAMDKDKVDWKSFLYQLIHSEGLDPWNIDVSILTKRYLEAFRELQTMDFNLSGKFLTIAVFLLKTKAENLVEKDLRGIEEQIAAVEMQDDLEDNFETLEGFDTQLDELHQTKSKEKYSLKIRNPIARKRKVNIFDLIKALEKTIEQSNKRKANFLVKHTISKYDGPIYEKKSKDLKSLISELYDFILSELNNKSGHMTFSHLTKNDSNKMSILEKFIPLLHLHNQDKVKLKQDSHFSEIEIHKI